MTKKDIVDRIEYLEGMCSAVGGRVDSERMLQGALTLMTSLYGTDSVQVKSLLRRRDDITQRLTGDAARNGQTLLAVAGALQNLREEVEGGYLVSLERRVTSDVLSDLIQLARAALDETTEGAKNVAAVLVAAAYEDTLRRIAKEHAGVIGHDNLTSVIDALKGAGLLVPPQLGMAVSHLNFRNRALHADWANIDRVAVQTVLAFVEHLLLKHFT